MKIRKFKNNDAVKPVEEENERIPKPDPKPAEPKEEEKNESIQSFNNFHLIKENKYKKIEEWTTGSEYLYFSELKNTVGDILETVKNIEKWCNKQQGKHVDYPDMGGSGPGPKK